MYDKHKFTRFNFTTYEKRETLYQCRCCGKVYKKSQGIMGYDGFSTLCPVCYGSSTIIQYKNMSNDAYMKVNYSKSHKVTI